MPSKKLKQPKSKSETAVNVENLIRDMVSKHGSPLMLIRRSILDKQFDRFKKCLPDIKPFYAIKANPHPEIIKHFIKRGACFDVASANEMNQVLKLGASPSNLIFANTIKSVADIIEARKKKVKMLTYDNEPELFKLSEHYPGAEVILRIKVENVGSQVPLSRKFGVSHEDGYSLLRKAKTLGLKPTGVSFHVGSQCRNVENYLQALEISAAIFNECEENGMPLKVLDIGGGFPIPHFDREIGINFERMAAHLRKQIRRLFNKKVKVIAEPGRFLVGPAGVLVTQVIGRTFRNNKNYYYLNDGIYGDFSGMVFDQCKYEFKTLRRGNKFLSALAGPTCDSFDTMATDIEIPELYVDDVVYVKNIGAYSSASAVDGFNGFSPAKIILV